MTRYARWAVVGAVASALVAWSLIQVTIGTAADEDQELKANILKLADVMAQKDMDAAKKQAQTIAAKVDEVEPVMDLMKPRGDGGLGVGTAGKVTPDGIEKKLLAMGKTPLSAPQAKDQGEALARAGYEVAAIAEVAKNKCPVKKKEGQKDPKDWAQWCDDMRQAALDFSDAAKAKDAGRLKAATSKLNSTCSNCHSVFRD